MAAEIAGVDAVLLLLLSSFQHNAFDNTQKVKWASNVIVITKIQDDEPDLDELDKAITVVNGHGYNCRANLSLHIIVPSTLLFQLRYIVIIATPKLPCIHPPSP